MKDNKIIEICLIIITICMVVSIGNTLYQQNKANSMMNEMGQAVYDTIEVNDSMITGPDTAKQCAPDCVKPCCAN